MSELVEEKEAAEEEAAELAATLADHVAALEFRDAQSNSLKETMAATGVPVEAPEVAVGHPVYFPVRSRACPSCRV